ncbi:hypothetical protein WJX77_002699 [Trebouxia sp. C0004]
MRCGPFNDPSNGINDIPIYFTDSCCSCWLPKLRQRKWKNSYARYQAEPEAPKFMSNAVVDEQNEQLHST